ncbi:hypothetical protein Tco_1024258 [Tanacetum coccineum]
MFQICPKVPGQKFVDPPFEEEILVFMSDLGSPGNIKSLSEVKVEILPQPWRTFGTIMNKCFNGKVTRLDLLRLSRAQILWGMYHQKNVDYVYLLWEDLVYQIENKVSKRNKDMYYPSFTKVIINHFMSQDQSIPRRNKYNAILLDNLTTQAMKGFEAYKTYYAFATGKAIPKPKSGKKKQLAKGLETLSEIALSEAEHMKTAIERSKTQIHSSQPTYGSDDEQISWKSSDEEDDDEANINEEEDNIADDDDADNVDDVDQGDDNEQTESDNDDDDFVHPKMTTFDEEERKDEEDKEEEDSDEEIQGVNVEEEEMDEEETNEEEEVDELYRDVNVNLERRDTEMTNAPHTIIQTTQVIEDTHVIITLVNPEDVPVTTIAETPLSSATTLPPRPTPLISYLQQTPATVPSSSLQDLPNFGSLFGFDHRLKTFENDFLELIQTNQFSTAVYAILGIVDTYLANKMNEAIKKAVQLQSNRLRDEAQAKNEDFINTLDDKIKKIIKEQVKEQVKAQISKILPKIENTKNLYKALVDAYESDKLILDTYGDTVSFKRRRDDEDKDEEPSAGSNRGSKRRRAGKEPESTSAPKEKTSKTIGKSTKGSKSHHESVDKSAQVEEPMHTTKELEEPAHQEFDIGFTKDQPVDETTQHHDWFQKPAKPPTPNHD